MDRVGGMCASTTALRAVRKDSAADLAEVRKPDKGGASVEFLAVSHISRTLRLGGSGGVAELGDDLTGTVVAQSEDGAVPRFTSP
ncbi:hypothetical protein ACIQ8D_20050 [Streptomyces sp. NPDC096094]|uniref:hypothetical protein n=1 Tax=Streptomyces sp. NPDC096094 TaxID=3366073 RepID=UPI0038210313